VNLRSFVLCLLVAAPAVAGAQTKITLRPTPKPQQTLHVTTTQEFSISMDPGPTAPGVQVLNKVVFDFTQSNGTFDDQDRMESRLVVKRRLHGANQSSQQGGSRLDFVRILKTSLDRRRSPQQ